jgi:hypothetical protein
MPRIRHVALLAVFALAGGLTLGGCGRAQPGTAAYVGPTRYTERQIDTIVGQLRKSPIAEDVSSPRLAAVSWLVIGHLAREAAAERSIAVPPADYTGIGQQLGSPADSALTHAVADWVTARTALQQRAEPVAPTEQDLREIFDGLRQNPQFPRNVTFEQAAAQLRNNPDLPLAVSMRNMLRDAANRHKVVVNPRYRPLRADVGDIPLVLAVGSDSVVDLPRS